jgi:predicted nucleotidyltransferase
MVSHPLLREAILITKELGDVVFVGATAVLLHIGKTRARESRDLDFAIAYDISDESLFDKKYIKYPRSGKTEYYSPRGFKLDIYTTDLNHVPVSAIVDTANKFTLDRYKTVKAASLEMLIILKYDANREQDNDDLHRLAVAKPRDINWEVLESLVNSYSEYEFDDIKRNMNELRNIPLL